MDLPSQFSIDPSPSDYSDILQSLQHQSKLADKFENLPKWFKDIIGDINLPGNDSDTIIEVLIWGEAASASNGPYLEDEKRGSHAYKIISTGTDFGLIQGASISPDSDKMSLLSTEHYGTISILVVLIVVVLYHHKEDGYGWLTLKLYIDNQEVINRRSRQNLSFLNIGQYLNHDFDLWMVISHLQCHLALQKEFEWIKGYQTPTEDMDEGTGILLNIDVDKLASAQYSKQTIIPQCCVFLAGTICYHQHGHDVQDIYNVISSSESDNNDMLDYYKSKGWTTIEFKLEDS